MKFLMISGNVFLDKFINGTITTARLVRIPDRLLDSELHKLDEIEPAVEQPAKSGRILNHVFTQSHLTSEEQFAETTPFFPDSKPKNVPLFPFKRRSTPFNLSATTVIQPAETGKVSSTLKSASDVLSTFSLSSTTFLDWRKTLPPNICRTHMTLTAKSASRKLKLN